MSNRLSWRHSNAVLILLFSGTVFVFYLRHNYVHNAADLVSLLLLGATIAGFYYGLRHVVRAGRALFIEVSVWQFVALSWFVTIITVLVIAAVFFKVNSPSVLLSLAGVVTGAFVVYSLFGSLWFLIGDRVRSLIRAELGSSFGNALLSVVFGIVITILYFYVAALAGFVSVAALLIFFVAGVLISYRSLPKLLAMYRSRIHLSFSFTKLGTSERKTLMLGIVLLLVVIGVINNLAPAPFDGDSVRGYYNIPSLIVQSGGIPHFVFDQLNNGAFASSYLYVPIILFGDQYLNFVNVVFLLLLIGSLYFFVRQFATERAAFYAVVLFVTMDLLIFNLVSVRSDFLIMLMLLWSFVLLYWYLYREKKMVFVLAAGALFGLAVAIKYNAGFALVGVIALLLSRLSRERFKIIVLAGAVFALLVAVFFSPWGLRLLLVYGSVVHPFSFAGFVMPPEALRLFFDEYSAVQYIVSSHNSFWHNLWSLAVNNVNYPNSKAGPFLFGLAPLIIFLRPKVFSRRLLFIIIPTLVVWYVVAVSGFWYFSFVFPLLIAVYAVQWDALSHRWLRIAIGAMVLVTLVLHLPVLKLDRMASYVSALEPQRVENIGYEKISDYANEKLLLTDPDYVLMPFGFLRAGDFIDNHLHIVPSIFYLSAPTETYLMETWEVFLSEGLTPEQRILLLREKGVTHIYHRPGFSKLVREAVCDAGPCETTQRLVDNFSAVREQLTVVHENPAWILYAL